MEIQTASDWWGVKGIETELLRRIDNLKPGLRRDLKTMIAACNQLAVDLNREEVECRRRHTQTKKHQELLATINERINYIDEMITLGMLMS